MVAIVSRSHGSSTRFTQKVYDHLGLCDYSVRVTAIDLDEQHSGGVARIARGVDGVLHGTNT